ncbi:hypothetical protein [Sedimentibacter sp. B4]|uniref:hypothetical protein n=1 Tax=Sedimentibacter sp. B4 TaxID=304766 RepID=UPI00030B0100|nr:hypothetical protein [Sedimentibacter sp. B4]
MPAIRKIRICGITYNDGNNIADNLLLDFEGLNSTYEAINGLGKSFILLCALQTIIPNSYLVAKNPFKKVFKGSNATKAAHVVVEWELDEGYPSKYLLTGFCAKKKNGEDKYTENQEDDGIDKSASMDYFNYLISYNSPHEYDAVHIPLRKENEANEKTIINYEGLKTNLQKFKKEIGLKNISVEIYGPNEANDLTSYKKSLAQYNIIDTEWSMLRQINAGEGNPIEGFFKNYKTADAFILKFIIPEIIEKSYMWKHNKDYQDKEKLANTLLDMKDQLKELTTKRSILAEYDYMIKVITELVSIEERLKTVFKNKNDLEEKLCMVINYLIAQVDELEEYKELYKTELITLDQNRKDTEKKQLSVVIKKKLIIVDEKNEELKERTNELNIEIAKKEKIEESIKFANSGNAYIEYKKAKSEYKELELLKEKREENVTDLKKQRNHYGTIYRHHINKQIYDIEDKVSELKNDRDLLVEKQSSLYDEKEALGKEHSDLKANIDVLGETIDKKEKTIEELKTKLLSLGVMDFSEDSFVRSKERLAKLENEEDYLNQEVQFKLPIERTQRENDKQNAEESYSRLNDSLSQKASNLEAYSNQKAKYLEIAADYDVPYQSKLSVVITKEIDKLKIEKQKKEDECNALSSLIKNLNEQKPLGVHQELRYVFDRMSKIYSSAQLGIDDIEGLESDDKKDILEKNILVPYSIILSDEHFDDFSNNNDLRLSFGDLAVPVISRSTVRSRDKLNLSSVQFSTKPVDLFIDEDLIKREIEKKKKELEERRNEENILKTSISVLDGHLKIATRFEFSYVEDFEKTINDEIAQIKSEITKVKENISLLEEKIKNLISLHQSKKEALDKLRLQIIDEREIVIALDSFIKLDNELSVEIPKFETLEEKEEKLNNILTKKNEEYKINDKSLVSMKDTIRDKENESSKLKELLQDVNTNITNVEINHLDYLKVKIDEAREQYQSIQKSIQEKDGGLIDLVKQMQQKEDVCGKAVEVMNYHGYTLDFLVDKDNSAAISSTSFEKLKALDIEKDEAEKLIEPIKGKKYKLEADIDNLNASINELKDKFKEICDSYYDDELFNNINDLDKYEESLNIEFRKIMKQIEEYKKSYAECTEKIDAFSKKLDSAKTQKESYDIKFKTDELSEDVNVIDGFGGNIKKYKKDIDSISENIIITVNKAKEKFKVANISNFTTELNDINIPKTLKDVEFQINSMIGEEGYIAIIEKEKSEIEKSIEDLRRLKEEFVELCSQRCNEVLNDIKKFSILSKIDIKGNQKEIIRLNTNNVPEPEYRKQCLSDYIDKLIEEIESYEKNEDKEKYLKEKLSLSNLFSKSFNELRRWDIDVYKFEDLADNSRPQKWKEIVGSTGQINTTYLMIAICLISYIRKLYNRNSNDTRKVILCDNPFGSSGATYLYEPLMQLLEVNNIQFICPGFNIPASLLGLFKVNYVLDQKLLPNNKLLLVTKTLEGRKQSDNYDYLFSGLQLKLEGL